MGRSRTALIFLFLVGLLSSTGMLHVGRVGAAAATWYVAPTGDDQADCLTSDTACRTIGATVSKATGGDRIAVAAGTYRERLNLKKDLEITGAGAAATLLHGGGGQVVAIQSGIRVMLRGLTIRNGRSTDGGGIFNQGILVLDASIITDNRAESGGGLYNSGAATLTGVTVSNNIVGLPDWIGSDGGGLYNSGSLTLTNVMLSSNAALSPWFCSPGLGGGLYNMGTATLTNVTVHRNFADSSPREFGGGDCPGEGGGIYHRDPPSQTRQLRSLSSTHDMSVQATVGLTLTNVTLSDNEAIAGSGLYNTGTAALTNVTLSGSSTIPWSGIESRSFNSTASILVTNSILATNARGGNCVRAYGGAIISNGHNLSSDGSCTSMFTAPGDRNDVDPLLGPLQDNGGPTPTHALRLGSPAIDAADPSHCPATDQRGVVRPLDGNQEGTALCDIGAFEYEFRPAFLYLPLVTTAAGTR